MSATAALGASLAWSRPRAGLALAVALALAAQDLVLAARGAPYSVRALPAALAAVVLVVLARGDARGVGLRTDPAGGWAHWARVGLLLGLVVAALVGLLIAAAPLLGLELELAGFERPGDFWRWSRTALGWAPPVEEAVYRLALCAPAAAVLGPRAAIALSGVLFAALHVVYGSPSPENVAGGFLLAWACVRSGSVFVPLALHAAGNLAVGLLRVAACLFAA